MPLTKTGIASLNREVLSKFLAQRHVVLSSWNPDVDRVVNELVERLGH